MAAPTKSARAEAQRELLAAARRFKALGDPARLRIVSLLAHAGELCNCQIEQVTGFGPSKISRHFSILKAAGWIADRRDGLWIHYSLVPAADEVARHLDSALAALPADQPQLRADRTALKSCRKLGKAC